MMNGGPSGFHNAPVTKYFVAASALLTVVIGMRHHPHPPLHIGLSYQDIFEKLRLWNLVSSVFAFSSTPELMFGLCLLYYFRVFERQIGSNKYSVFMAFSIVVSLSLEVLALAYLKDTSYTLAPGPYGLTFAAFVPFYFDIPVSSRIHIFGANFSDKSFIYLAGLQLLFSSLKRSIIPGCCGLLAGFLYHLSAFGIRRIKFPNALVSFISRLRWPLSTNSSPTLSTGNTLGNRHFQDQLEDNYPPAHYPIPGPPDTSVATLVSMGFDVDSARQALMLARNDINAAASNLLEAQSR